MGGDNLTRILAYRFMGKFSSQFFLWFFDFSPPLYKILHVQKKEGTAPSALTFIPFPQIPFLFITELHDFLPIQSLR